MSSLALRAAIGIVVKDRQGEWCTAAWIASRVAAPVQQVLFECEELVLAGDLRFDMRAGDAVFGFEVVDDYPVINDKAVGHA